ncbi:5'/3'-nucleotidase SurE [Chloroflexota bacterium]
MRVLVTNDDGISSDGLWALVAELKKVAEVTVVAPSEERSAVGTAVSLFRPLSVKSITPSIPDVEAYSTDGTPSDSVILALGKLAANRIDMVVSGINPGPNLGDDAFISGTAGAALQGYLHGLPALAISLDGVNSHHVTIAAKVAALLAEKIDQNSLPHHVLLNVNMPNLPLHEIKGLRVTQPANHSHGHSVIVKQDGEGKQSRYHLIRQRLTNDTGLNTDVAAIERGDISITPLHNYWFDPPSTPFTDDLFSGMLQELQY